MSPRDLGSASALVLMGVSGSGKTTIAIALAKELGWTCEDADKFHPKANVEKMAAGHPLSDHDRLPWLQAIAAEIDHKRERGEPVVIACSALKRAYREILVHGQPTTRIVYLYGSRELIAQRLRNRKGHFMPPELLDSQFDALEEPGADERPIVVNIDAGVERIIAQILDALRAAD